MDLSPRTPPRTYNRTPPRSSIHNTSSIDLMKSEIRVYKMEHQKIVDMNEKLYKEVEMLKAEEKQISLESRSFKNNSKRKLAELYESQVNQLNALKELNQNEYNIARKMKDKAKSTLVSNLKKSVSNTGRHIRISSQSIRDSFDDVLKSMSSFRSTSSQLANHVQTCDTHKKLTQNNTNMTTSLSLINQASESLALVPKKDVELSMTSTNVVADIEERKMSPVLKNEETQYENLPVITINPSFLDFYKRVYDFKY